MKAKGYKTYGKNRSLRLKGFDYSQRRPYFVTICTRDGRPVLHDELAKNMVSCLSELKVSCDFKLYAYCIMPDHVHLLLSPGDSMSSLPKVIQAFKSVSTREYRANGAKSLLWQTYFYDHVVRKEADLNKVAKYILENPVREGMVKDWQDYPFCGPVDSFD
ncbi:MAG: REP-associated tyrosine transposase [Planctomycetota bacterium]|jgi:REP element-mobilizing transposase RayT